MVAAVTFFQVPGVCVDGQPLAVSIASEPPEPPTPPAPTATEPPVPGLPPIPAPPTPALLPPFPLPPLPGVTLPDPPEVGLSTRRHPLPRRQRDRSRSSRRIRAAAHQGHR